MSSSNVSFSVLAVLKKVKLEAEASVSSLSLGDQSLSSGGQASDKMGNRKCLNISIGVEHIILKIKKNAITTRQFKMVAPRDEEGTGFQ